MRAFVHNGSKDAAHGWQRCMDMERLKGQEKHCVCTVDSRTVFTFVRENIVFISACLNIGAWPAGPARRIHNSKKITMPQHHQGP